MRISGYAEKDRGRRPEGIHIEHVVPLARGRWDPVCIVYISLAGRPERGLLLDRDLRLATSARRHRTFDESVFPCGVLFFGFFLSSFREFDQSKYDTSVRARACAGSARVITNLSFSRGGPADRASRN